MMNRKSTKSKALLRKVKSADGGKRFSVPSHPPSFTSAPWFNLVVRIDAPGAIITTTNLRDQLANQIGNAIVGTYHVRLQSVRFWGSLGIGSGSLPPPINVLINDPIAISTAVPAGGTGTRVLEQITDYPDVVRRACFGYRYPKAQRETAIFLSGVAAGNLYVTNGLGANSVVYVNLQWRFAPTLPPGPSTDDELVEALKSFTWLPWK